VGAIDPITGIATAAGRTGGPRRAPPGRASAQPGTPGRASAQPGTLGEAETVALAVRTDLHTLPAGPTTLP
jgi:hypothetical protein